MGLSVKWCFGVVHFCRSSGAPPDLQNEKEFVLGVGDFNGHVEKVSKVCMKEMELGREIWREECCWSIVMKKKCAWRTLGIEKMRGN